MKISAVINERFTNTEVHVCKDRMDDEVKNLVSTISEFLNDDIYAVKENGDHVSVSLYEAVLFFAENAKVYVRTAKEEYIVPCKLYELEERLKDKEFFRTSKSELVNIRMIKQLDMSLSGTIRVIMKDGSEVYTSRRNVTKLKQVLGI